jgi:hypothetical protein
MFFSLSSLELGLILFGIVLGSTLVGWSPGEFSAPREMPSASRSA